MSEKHLTPQDLAERWSVPASALARMRCEGNGPVFVKFGASRSARIRYRLSDVLAWEDASARSNTGRAA
jgi:hypothetical protein